MKTKLEKILFEELRKRTIIGIVEQLYADKKIGWLWYDRLWTFISINRLDLAELYLSVIE